MRILVTGSSGFIASRLIMELINHGHEVAGFDVKDGQDIRNLGTVRNAVKGKDVVMHLAAVADLNWARANPLQTMDINVKGTWNVAMACQEAGAKMFFSSTCCTYGTQSTHPTYEWSLPNPNEIYACSKLAGEALIKGFKKTFGGPDYNLMRFATIYGPGTRAAMGTHIFMGQALRGEPLTVHGDGTQTRTLTYVDDLVDGIVALLRSGYINDVWNLTAQEEISAIQMAHDIIELTGSASEIKFIPQRVGQTFRESISAAKMYDATGWKAKTPWADGLKKMLTWYVGTNQRNVMYQMPEAEKVK